MIKNFLKKIHWSDFILSTVVIAAIFWLRSAAPNPSGYDVIGIMLSSIPSPLILLSSYLFGLYLRSGNSGIGALGMLAGFSLLIGVLTVLVDAIVLYVLIRVSAKIFHSERFFIKMVVPLILIGVALLFLGPQLIMTTAERATDDNTRSISTTIDCIQKKKIDPDDVSEWANRADSCFVSPGNLYISNENLLENIQECKLFGTEETISGFGKYPDGISYQLFCIHSIGRRILPLFLDSSYRIVGGYTEYPLPSPPGGKNYYKLSIEQQKKFDDLYDQWEKSVLRIHWDSVCSLYSNQDKLSATFQVCLDQAIINKIGKDRLSG